MLPALLFSQQGWPDTVIFSQAEIHWIPRRVKDLYGEDPARVKEHFNHYPALREARLRPSAPMERLEWTSVGPGLGLRVEWREASTGLMLSDRKTVNDLGIASYKAADDFVITPAIGSMTTGLHPILALWAVLLALSSLARYEPATWSKIVDIDRSAEADAIEHLLDQAIESVPATALHMLTTLE
jgi:hypothetical protein